MLSRDINDYWPVVSTEDEQLHPYYAGSVWLRPQLPFNPKKGKGEFNDTQV